MRIPSPRLRARSPWLTEEDRIACQLLGMSEAEFAAHKQEIARA
ncbi:phage protease [Thermomonas sp. S9]|nr:phage protease [Thermomonas sp. S9]MCR6494796.1 phage protease [Thermomonas sp. S9]